MTTGNKVIKQDRVNGGMTKAPVAEGLVGRSKENKINLYAKDASEGLIKDSVSHKEQKLSGVKGKLPEPLSRGVRTKKDGSNTYERRKDVSVQKNASRGSAPAKISVKQKTGFPGNGHLGSKEKQVSMNNERKIANDKGTYRDVVRPRSSHTHAPSKISSGTPYVNQTRTGSTSMARQALEPTPALLSASAAVSSIKGLRRSISESDLQQENGGLVSSLRSKWPAANNKILVKMENRSGSKESVKRHSQATIKNQGSDIKQLRPSPRLKATPVTSKEASAQKEMIHPTKLPTTRAPGPNTGSHRLLTSGDAPYLSHEARLPPRPGSTPMHPKLAQRSLNKLPSSKLRDLKSSSPDRVWKTPNPIDKIVRAKAGMARNLHAGNDGVKAIKFSQDIQVDEPSLFTNGGVNLVSMSSTSSEDYRIILDLPDP